MFKKIFLVGLSAVLFFGAADTIAQGKKKKGKKVAAPPATTTAAVAPAAPPAPEAPKFRYLPEDSVDYNGTGYNPLSTFPVHVSQVMYRMKIRRLVDLKEKCNVPFFNNNFEVTKYIMEGIKSGALPVFDKDTITKVLPLDMAMKVLTYSNELDTTIKETVRPEKITEFVLFEDLIFDRQRSISTYDIQYVYIYVPIGVKGSGQTFNDPIGVIRYKDLEKWFDRLPAKARWKNPFNNREDKTFTDAFRLRLFCGRIVRLLRDNSTGEDISALPEYNSSIKKQLIASLQFEYDIISEENELYEY